MWGVWLGGVCRSNFRFIIAKDRRRYHDAMGRVFDGGK